MATRLKAGMVVNVDWITATSVHGKPVTLIRFHQGGWLKELGQSNGPGWLCQHNDGRFRVYQRCFLEVNRYDERGSGPPDPRRHDWYLKATHRTQGDLP